MNRPDAEHGLVYFLVRFAVKEFKNEGFFFKKKAYLHNGQIVREGEFVSFVNSDGKICIDKIKRRSDGTLYFWNSFFDISEYTNAIKI